MNINLLTKEKGDYLYNIMEEDDGRSWNIVDNTYNRDTWQIKSIYRDPSIPDRSVTYRIV